MKITGRMANEFLLTNIDKATVVEFQTPSLMEPAQLKLIETQLTALVDEQDRRLIILDFSRVEYISSQAIGIVIILRRKLAALPHSKFMLCGISAKLMELLKITRLDRILTIKPSQKEAINAMAML
jgi:anti-sigma B factor antagonist